MQSNYIMTNASAPESKSNYLQTPGAGKVQLPDGRWVSEGSILGKDYLGKVAAERERAEFKQTLGDLMQRADPFAGQRAQYQTSLADLMRDPAAATASNPFFKASADAGQEAASRRLAQMGMSNSGNAALELQKNAQANLSQDFFRMADLLGGFSGAKADPSAAATAGLGAMGLREKARQFDFENTGQVLMPGQSKRGPSLMSLGSYWGQ